MRWLKLASIGVISPMAIVFSGCSSSGRTTVVEAWDERPRFFTAEADEEHSTFAKVVWYERPRLFTRAEDEDHSRFEQILDTRPRIFTSQTNSNPGYVNTLPSTTYPTPTYHTHTTYKSMPVVSQTISRAGHGRIHRVTTEKTYDPSDSTSAVPNQASSMQNRETNFTRDMVSPSSRTSSYNSYGSATHRNLTERDIDTQSNMRVQLTSDVSIQSFDKLISKWTQDAREAAQAMREKYGVPDSSTSERLIWRNRDPFAEIIVFGNGTPHNHPNQHIDVVSHSIYFHVDAEKMDDLPDFHGNVKVDYERGLLTAKCKDEAMNLLALNLAHDILTDNRSVGEANSFFSEKSRAGVPDDDYMKELQFDIGEDITGENRPNPLNVGIDVDFEADFDTDAEYGVDDP